MGTRFVPFFCILGGVGMKEENSNKREDEGTFFFGDDPYYSGTEKKKKPETEENQTLENNYLGKLKEKETVVPHSQIYRPKKSFLGNVFEWLDVVVTSIAAVVIIFSFVFRIVAIEGSSMNNTLFDGERIIISNMFYEPSYGDIVVISRNTENSSKGGTYAEPIIKRIIATEGDKVDIDFQKGIVYVNDKPLKEDYTKEPTYSSSDVSFPLIVKEDCVFVLGDNRNDSLDSRSSEIGEDGQINKKYILGHAVMRVFPINKFGGIE